MFTLLIAKVLLSERKPSILFEVLIHWYGRRCSAEFPTYSPAGASVSLVHGDNKAQDTIEDVDLLSLFNKAQNLSKKQKETVKDFLSAFVLKADLTQKLAQ